MSARPKVRFRCFVDVVARALKNAEQVAVLNGYVIPVELKLPDVQGTTKFPNVIVRDRERGPHREGLKGQTDFPQALRDCRDSADSGLLVCAAFLH